MTRVYTAQHAWDAQMVCDVLIASGIEAMVQQANAGIHHVYRDTVHILNEEDEPRASALVREFDAGAVPPPGESRAGWPWRCRCGEQVEPQFTACWSCGDERQRAG